MVTLYVLLGETGRRYVVITKDLSRRLVEHQTAKSSVYRLLGSFHVIHTEEFPDHVSAREREKFLKSGQGRSWLDEHFPRTEPAGGG